MRRWALFATLYCTALTALHARADDAVLHEYIPEVDPREVAAALNGRANARAAPDGAEAAAEKPAAQAETEAEPGAGEPRANVPSTNSDNFKPDRLTSLEDGLDYYEAFNPAIAPFKRVLSLDAIRLDNDGKTPVLGVNDARRKPQAIALPGGLDTDPRPRDLFEGELDIDFRDGPVARLPSVSPESRILRLATTPPLVVRVEKDAADNFYLHALGKTPDAPVHVTFLSDAPRAYFGSEVPRVPLRSLKDAVPALPSSVSRRALHFARSLGLTPKSDLATALATLTRHFRSFTESSEPPEDTGDLYLDLARGKKGLCRHRAYGFVVTAHALGIAARFVQNEAHSFVEVKLPTGFLRIDLGGAAHGLTAHNAHDRPSYVPAQPDTLPQPAAYQRSYAQAERTADTSYSNAQKGDPESSTGRWLKEPAAPPMAAAPGPASQPGPASRTAAAGKVPVHIELGDQRITTLRGGKQVLTGRVLDDARHGAAGLRVELYIAREQRKERMLLGVSVTDADGYFRAAFGVPPDLEVGDYRMIVVSQADAEHLSAVAQ